MAPQDGHSHGTALRRTLALTLAIASAMSIAVLSPAFGADCTASGEDAACRGFEAEALGLESTAIGTQVIACEARSTAFGLSTKAQADSVFVVGRRNALAAGDQCAEFKLQGVSPLFVVGNGLHNGPISEQNRNALTVLENGTTVLGIVGSPETAIDVNSTLNVLGDAVVNGNLGLSNGDLQAGTGAVTVNRSPGASFREVGIWSAGAPKSTDCATACRPGVCLVAYADTEAVKQLACSTSQLNKTCLCAGRR